MDKTRVSTKKIDTGKLLQQVASLREIARKEGWRFSYDPELDELFYSPQVIPPDNILISVGDELSVYVDKNSKINGIFIEYFKTNYLRHEKELQDVQELFVEPDDGGKTIRKGQNGDVTLLETAMQNEILSNLVKKLKPSEKGLQPMVFA